MDIIRIQICTFILFTFSSFALSGCGGDGDDGSSSSTPTQTLIPLATSVIRTYQQGDMLTTTLTIRDADAADGQTISGDVTITVGEAVTNPFGIECRALIYSGNSTNSVFNGTNSGTTLFYQDASGSLYACGKSSGDSGRYVFLTDTAASPNGIILETKSPMQLGDTTSGIIYYDDGTWTDCTRTVVAIENVSVPIGLYETYKVSVSCSYGGLQPIVGTIWTVPDVFNLKESLVAAGLERERLVTSVSLN
jgi:hypothetical protein